MVVDELFHRSTIIGAWVVLGQQKKSAFVTEPRPLLWGQNLVIRGWLGDVGAHARAEYDPGFGSLLQVLSLFRVPWPVRVHPTPTLPGLGPGTRCHTRLE